MSEQDKRTARNMPQRWKLERGPDGAWNTAQMTTTEDGEWCKADDVAAALRQAYQEGVEAIITKLRECAEWKLHMIASTGEWRNGYKAAIEWLIENAARLLLEKEEA